MAVPYRFVLNPQHPVGHPVRAYHECWPAQGGRYRMPGDWIDTDNRCWSEPVHFYTPQAPEGEIA